MYELQVDAEFAAAHNLIGYEGACENLHGHNWKVRLVVCGLELDKLGMLMDFKDLKKILNNIMDLLDHKYLNEVSPFDKMNPTTENLARFISEKADLDLPDNVMVKSVRVWESARASATYIPER